MLVLTAADSRAAAEFLVQTGSLCEGSGTQDVPVLVPHSGPVFICVTEAVTSGAHWEMERPLLCDGSRTAPRLQRGKTDPEHADSQTFH